jgi:hypothetical protein
MAFSSLLIEQITFDADDTRCKNQCITLTSTDSLVHYDYSDFPDKNQLFLSSSKQSDSSDFFQCINPDPQANNHSSTKFSYNQSNQILDNANDLLSLVIDSSDQNQGE